MIYATADNVEIDYVIPKGEATENTIKNYHIEVVNNQGKQLIINEVDDDDANDNFIDCDSTTTGIVKFPTVPIINGNNRITLFEATSEDLDAADATTKIIKLGTTTVKKIVGITNHTL